MADAATPVRVIYHTSILILLLLSEYSDIMKSNILHQHPQPATSPWEPAARQSTVSMPRNASPDYICILRNNMTAGHTTTALLQHMVPRHILWVFISQQKTCQVSRRDKATYDKRNGWSSKRRSGQNHQPSTPDSKLIFSTNLFLHSSSTFPPTGLTPRTPGVFRFSLACRF